MAKVVNLRCKCSSFWLLL